MGWSYVWARSWFITRVSWSAELGVRKVNKMNPKEKEAWSHLISSDLTCSIVFNQKLMAAKYCRMYSAKLARNFPLSRTRHPDAACFMLLAQYAHYSCKCVHASTLRYKPSYWMLLRQCLYPDRMQRSGMKETKRGAAGTEVALKAQSLCLVSVPLPVSAMCPRNKFQTIRFAVQEHVEMQQYHVTHHVISISNLVVCHSCPPCAGFGSGPGMPSWLMYRRSPRIWMRE